MVRSVEKAKTIKGKYLIKDVAGNSNVTLTEAEWDNAVLEFTGALTGNIAITIPLSSYGHWIVYCHCTTSNGSTLTVKGGTGSGTAVTLTKKVILYSNGSDIVPATAEL
jgi:hypothetical protein